MNKYKIAVLAGDGIGREITVQAVHVLQTAADKSGFEIAFEDGLIGGCAIDACGEPLPRQTLELCRTSDAVLLGAVGGPKWDGLEGSKRPEAGLLSIRAALGLYANLRPAVVVPALRYASPLKDEILDGGLDIMIVRELTGGIYFGSRGRCQTNGEKSAFDTEKYSESEIARIAHTAFKSAEKRSRKLCSVDKANVLESSRLWRETVCKVAKEYPRVELTHMYVDNAAMQLVRAPKQFDTIVTSNMFGDILSDEASQITGSIGMLPSASLGSGTLGLYEPIHGSAPDIAGKDVANPLATILSAAMLLRYSLGQENAAAQIEQAVNNVLEKGLRTADIAEKGIASIGCAAMGNAVVEELKKASRT